MRSVRVRPLGLLQHYPPDGERGVLMVDVESTDTINTLLARVGQQFNAYFLPALWNADTRQFHAAVHVFLDSAQARDRQQQIGDVREVILLLEIAGGAHS